MLIAMLTVFLLGGGLMGGSMLSPADVDLIGERVELVINDPARSAEAMLVLDQLNTEVENFNQNFIDSGDTLRDRSRLPENHAHARGAQHRMVRLAKSQHQAARPAQGGNHY